MHGQGAASGLGWAPPEWVPSWAAGPPGPAANGPAGSRTGFAVGRPPLAVDRPTVAIDFGTASAAAMVVTEQGSWLVPDPASGEARWPCAIHWDGHQMVVGAAAVHRGQVDPGGYRAGLRSALVDDNSAQLAGAESASNSAVLGSRPLRSVEAAAEFLAAVRGAAGRLLASLGQPHGTPPDRAVVTVPPAATPALRGRLVEAAEAAGFRGVELVPDPAAAVWAPGLPLRMGDLVLVYDAGARVDATLVRVGEGLPEILGHESWVDGQPGTEDIRPAIDTQQGIDRRQGIDIQPGLVEDLRASPGGIDRALAGCRDLLTRLGVSPTQVSWVVLVGGGARTPGLGARLEHGLGITVAMVDEPELAVIRGAAAWLPHSGSRCVHPRGADQRLVPLAYTIPGYTARLLRWLVEPRQPYAEGAVVARVRLATGAVWDLTVRSPGVLDEVLVPAGRDIRSGEWLALVRPA